MRTHSVTPTPLMPGFRGMSVAGALGIDVLAKRFFQYWRWRSQSALRSHSANQRE